MRFGVLGLGSMGTRRVRDLLAQGHEIHGFDIRADRNARAAERFGVTIAASQAALLGAGLDGLVISTPPDQHGRCYRAAFAAHVPFFSEASILTPRCEWLAEEEARSGVRGYPSATWRFYAPLAQLAQRLARPQSPRIHSVHHQYADFLPRWHPWENYWEFYAGASKRTCAAREMVPFELEWLCWLFGEVASVAATVERFGQWRTDINDAYFLQLRFVNGVFATLGIELYRPAAERAAMILGADVSYRLDYQTHALHEYVHEQASWITVPSESAGASCDLERVYAAEIAAFAAAVAGTQPYLKSWAEDRHLSDVLFAAELSATQRRWVDVEEVRHAYDGTSLD